MRRVPVILFFTFFSNYAIGQNVSVAKNYTCYNGFEVSRGDTIYLAEPANSDGTYKSIFRDKQYGKDEPLTKQDNESYLVVKRIARYYGGTDKEYAYLQSDGTNVRNYTIDIDKAITENEVVIPDGFTAIERKKNNPNAYTATNGITYRIGDTVKLGRGSSPDGHFRYLNIGGWASILLYDSNRGSEQFDIDRSMSGLSVIVKAINYYKFRGTTKVIFGVGGGNITNYNLSIEDAIATCEVLPCNNGQSGATIIQPLSTADEIKKLYELKKEGILTEEEFQQQKEKLLSK